MQSQRFISRLKQQQDFSCNMKSFVDFVAAIKDYETLLDQLVTQSSGILLNNLEIYATFGTFHYKQPSQKKGLL
jgi:hypothetical protein